MSERSDRLWREWKEEITSLIHERQDLERELEETKRVTAARIAAIDAKLATLRGETDGK